jgi:hypothetical protein
LFLQYIVFICFDKYQIIIFNCSCSDISFAYFQVAEVEEEMRELLSENQSSKKAMEDKMKRLTQAMTDLQTDLYQ